MGELFRDSSTLALRPRLQHYEGFSLKSIPLDHSMLQHLQRVHTRTLDPQVPHLKSLEIRKVEIGDAIDASNSAFLDAEDKIKKAREMIKRANLLLSKVESVHFDDIARLEQLRAQNDEVL